MDFEALNSMRKETDRAAAVLGAAFLETALGELFEVRCGARITADMLRANGVLGAFANRIRMSYALGWIAEDTHHDLHLVRKIRNEFAHLQDHTLSFATPSIADTARELRVLQAIEAVVTEAAAGTSSDPTMIERLQRFKPARVRYDFAIMLLSDAIDEAKSDPAVSAAGARSAVAIARRGMTNVLGMRLGQDPPPAA